MDVSPRGKLTGVKINPESRLVDLSWDGNNELQTLPIAFLRDNCLCPACYNKSSGGRLILMREFQPLINILGTTIKDDGELEVSWEDGHVSSYPPDWLAARDFSPATRADRAKLYKRKPKLWRAELKEHIPNDTFQNILNDDRALYKWITEMEDVGLFIIRDTPLEQGQIQKLARRVAYLRLNSYGPVFTVKSKENPNNIAYTSATIGLHIDLPALDYIPGIQMLHCIKQTRTEGGDNEFCDAFEVARQLKESYPDDYRILTTIPCDYRDRGEDESKFDMLSRKPVIMLDSDGQVEQIVYNNQIRDSFVHVPVEKVQPLYNAIKQFDDLLYDKSNAIQIKLKEGEIVCFHNYRVMHGRLGYSATGGCRHLEGGYIDWDELRSRRRVLQSELGLAE